MQTRGKIVIRGIRANGKPFLAASWFLALLFAAYGVARLVVGPTGIWDAVPNDFSVFMSWGEFIRGHPAREIYDADILHAFQVKSGWPDTIYAPCPYPPPFIYFLAALSFLPTKVAWAIWMGGTLIAFAGAVYMQVRTTPALLATLALPVVPIAIISGQNGFLSAALIIAGFSLARPKPVMAGIFIGFLAYKPQLGLLVPVALAAAGMWRTFASAAVTVVSVILLVGILAGWGIWVDWIESLGSFAGNTLSFGDFSYLMPTVASDLGRLGIGSGFVQVAQAATTCLMAALTWTCFRKEVGPGQVAVLCAATVLATPYAYVYDMAATAPALVTVIAARMAAGGTFSVLGAAVLVAFAVIPIALTVPGFPFPPGAVCTAAFLTVAARHALRGSS